MFDWSVNVFGVCSPMFFNFTIQPRWKDTNRITQPAADLNWEILMSRQLRIRYINVCGKMVTGYKTKVTTVNVTQGDGDIRPSTDTRHRNRIISYLHGNTGWELCHASFALSNTEQVVLTRGLTLGWTIVNVSSRLCLSCTKITNVL